MEKAKDDDNEVKVKVHSGFFQISKEYPEMYLNLLLIKNKLARQCPDDWKVACKERSERLEMLLEELKPERIKEESEKRCKDLKMTINQYVKCKEVVYSKYCNQVLTETQKLNFFFNNINKFS